ncbi:MAG: hypothetical protein AAF456_17195 [Planctomycetota bacterium]
MRILLLVVWMLIPVGALAYHLGPGQDHMKLDEASQLLHEADYTAANAIVDPEQSSANELWTDADATYSEALEMLPSDTTDTQYRVRLERAKAQMQAKQLPEAHQDLLRLVDDLEAADEVDAALLEDARGTLASAKYYMTWLMRLEGLDREAWQDDIESSQQNYRLLASNALDAGDSLAYTSYIEDLESAVRLQRMDLGELQGLPLPNQ